MLKPALPVHFMRIFSLLTLSAIALATGLAREDEDLYLPLPEMEPMLESNAPQQASFLKPTKSIKPPAPGTQAAMAPAQVAAATVLPTVNAPTTQRLRRLVLVSGGTLPQEAIQSTMVASGHGSRPVTMVDVETPATVLVELAEYFGREITDDTGKKVIDTVQKGLKQNTSSSRPRKVEVVGWLPKEGVMAVAVYPDVEGS